MRIFVAGATGAIGKRLVPLLVASGHSVVATTRKHDKIAALRQQGVEPMVVDGLDKDAVLRSVMLVRPEVIVHQMTALASVKNYRNFDREFEVTNRLRSRRNRVSSHSGGRGRHTSIRGAELQRLAECTRGRPGQDGGRSA